MSQHWISLMILLPALGAVLQATLPKRAGFSQWVALLTSVAAGLIGIILVLSSKSQSGELLSTEVFSWVGAYSISYDVGLDGLNSLLVLGVSIIFPVLIAAECQRKVGGRGVHGLLLLLQTSAFGALCSQDLFLLFFFWAFSSLPICFLIGIWGGKNKESASYRSIVVSSIGNALFFGALLLIYHAAEPHTFSLRELTGGKLESKTFQFLEHDLSISWISLLLIGSGLSFRAPIWPLSGWFSSVAEEAPPTAFVAISSVLVPISSYIFMRLGYSLFPSTFSAMSPWIVFIGALNLLVGSLCAAAQRDLRRLLAFVCMSEVGLILIGVGSMAPAGVVGAVYQQFALCLGLAGFGLFAGIIAERTGTTEFAQASGRPNLGGIVSCAPALAVAAGLFVTSLLGFPGLGGFVGHSLLVIGTFPLHPAVVILAGIVLTLGAYYFFLMYRHVFLGAAGESVGAGFEDLTIWERGYLLPLIAFLLVFGIYPKPLIEIARPTVLALLATLK